MTALNRALTLPRVPAFGRLLRMVVRGGLDKMLVLGNPALRMRSKTKHDTGAIVYVLYDAFTTDLPAGAVNGTVSEPPPGIATGGGKIRTVTDGNNVLSIASGALTFASGGVGAGNPGLWSEQITRVTGILSLTQVTITANSIAVGWDAGQSGIISEGVNFSSSGNLSAIQNAGGRIVGVYSAGVTYTVAVILRGVGSFELIKGGAFTTFRLLWASAVSGGNMYPAIGVPSGTTQVGTGDNMRVPDPALYATSVMALLKALVYDSFTRANGAMGNTETTDPDGQTISAFAWVGSSTFAISGNVAVNTPSTGADVIVNGDFDTDTDWTKGSGWTIAGGVAVATATTGNLVAAVGPFTLGTWYRVTFTISGFTGGSVRVLIGGASPHAGNYSANGTFVTIQKSLGTSFTFDAQTSFTANIDDVSAVPLTLSELITAVQISTTPDVLASVEITETVSDGATQGGMVLNLDSESSPQNFVLAYIDREAGDALLFKCVAGVYTLLASGPATYAAGGVLRVIKEGTSYSMYWQNAQIATTQVVSDAGIINNTLMGLFATANTVSLNNFTVHARGTNGEYEALGAY